MLKKYFDEEKYLELQNTNDLVYKALEITTTLFENDTDKGGNPYMLHIIYVYRHVNTIEEKIIALLHDVIEDKDVDKNDLLELGFPRKIVDDIVSLTRVRPIEYNDYINNIIRNGSKEALRVKLVDLENNIDISRIKNPTVKDYERVTKRYLPAYEKVSNKLEELLKRENDE